MSRHSKITVEEEQCHLRQMASHLPYRRIGCIQAFDTSTDADIKPYLRRADSISARCNVFCSASVPAGSFHRFAVPLPPGGRQERMPVALPFSVGADSISARRRLSDRLPPGWEQGAVALPQRPAPQGCLKEKAQSKEDISVPTEENRGKHLIKGKSLLSYPPAPSTASRSPSLPEGGRKIAYDLAFLHIRPRQCIAFGFMSRRLLAPIPEGGRIIVKNEE